MNLLTEAQAMLSRVWPRRLAKGVVAPRTVRVSLVAVLAMVVAACTAAPTATTPAATATATTETPTTETPGPTATTTQSGVPERLIVAIPTDPFNLELNRSAASAAYQIVGPNIADSLAFLDVNHGGAAEPNLATSWERIGPNTLRVELRDDVVFSDGSPLTAADVAASMNYGRTDPPENMYRTYFRSVTDVEVVDEYTVDITTDGVDPVLERRLTFMRVMPEDTLDLDFLADNLIGSGRYILARWEKGQSILLERNDSYWGEAPLFAEVEFLIRPDEAVRVAAVRAGEAHIALFVSPEVAAGAPQVIETAGLEVAGFLLNTTGQKPGGSIMSDKNVRLAINQAIDREAIAEFIYGGATLPKGHYNPPFFDGIVPTQVDYAYDPDLASSLLEEAGVVGSTVSILINTDWPKAGELGEAVGGYLNAVGLEVEFTAVETEQWISSYGTHREGAENPYDMVMLQHGNQFFEPIIRTFPNLIAGSYLIQDDIMNQLIADASEELDVDRRNELSRQVWSRIHEEAYMLPIVVVNNIYVATSEVVWEPRLSGEFFVEDVGWSG